MTYSIYAKGTLTMKHCRIADKEIASGLLEALDETIVNFHNLEIDDINPARELMNRFGFTVLPDIFEEHIHGSYCEEKLMEGII